MPQISASRTTHVSIVLEEDERFRMVPQASYQRGKFEFELGYIAFSYNSDKPELPTVVKLGGPKFKQDGTTGQSVHRNDGFYLNPSAWMNATPVPDRVIELVEQALKETSQG